jgi:sugar/nucleoside kinase (ribokinase family)
MQLASRLDPIDYLAIGHITVDLTADGPRLGGSAAYAALTAQALGLRAGILTAWAEELPLGPLADLPIVNLGAEVSSTFQNTYSDSGRSQRYHGEAQSLDFHHIPEVWRNPRILHLAPVAGEVSARILSYAQEALRVVTPQGWLRGFDADGYVHPSDWEEDTYVLSRADAAVLSLDDVGGDVTRIERLAAVCPALVATDGDAGSTLYAAGDQTHIPAPSIDEVIDSTGAGDVFAAAFFVRLQQTGNALESARFASFLASGSVRRPGLTGIPTQDEIYDTMAGAY